MRQKKSVVTVITKVELLAKGACKYLRLSVIKDNDDFPK